MPKKPNAFLQQFEERLKADYLGRFAALVQVAAAAALISANDKLHLGPGRALEYLQHYNAVLSEINQMSLEDEGDRAHTRHDMAVRLREILGPDGWQQARECFEILQPYWEA